MLLLLNNILRLMQLLMDYDNEGAQPTEEAFSEREIECLQYINEAMSITARFDRTSLSWASDITAG
jgi:hypothetical protein